MSPADYRSGLFEIVLPKHAIAGTDFMTDWLYRPWPSAGPFLIESFDLDATLLTLVRNPEYRRTDAAGRRLPYLDRVVFGRLPAFLEAMPQSFEYDDHGDPGTAPIVVDRLREFRDLSHEYCGEDGAFDAMGITDEGEQALLSAALFQATQTIAIELLEEGAIVEVPVFDLTRVDDLADAGIEVAAVSNTIWEHLAFHYGDMRLIANPDSLVEHLEFRQAVAHAIDRDRIAAETWPIPARRIDGIIEAFSPTFKAPELPYTYDPDRARELVGALCDRLGRDCEADPLRLRFSYDGRLQARPRLAEMLVEMLGEVGIVVDAELRPLFVMIDSCDGWESSTWAWSTQPGFSSFATAYEVLDPNVPARAVEGQSQLYAWGTGAVEGIPDDPHVQFGAPPSPDCDESLVYNQGPSSVRDEFSERYGELLRDLGNTVDRDVQLQIVNEMESIIADRVVFIPLYARPAAYAMRSDLVGGMGYAIQFGNEPKYWNLEQWYLKEPAG
jgi:ABC-type transport system substrate-binding protein